MIVKCKYCGNPIEINGKYLNPQPGGYVCCLSCEHNPRNKIVKGNHYDNL